MDPGTMPPPSTKSNSPMPVQTRDVRADLTSRSRTGALTGVSPPTDVRILATGLTALAATSSTRVFHSPQASHRPAHFG